jgi:alkylation response protein AidB-like acyl-CoA dehydrogenase
MDFDYSPKQKELMARVGAFMDQHVYPAEDTYTAQMTEARAKGNPWIVVPIVEELKAKAKKQGLWNLFLNESEHGAGLSNLEYAPLAEIMGMWVSRPRFSTAPRPIPATWKCWSAMVRPTSRTNG